MLMTLLKNIGNYLNDLFSEEKVANLYFKSPVDQGKSVLISVSNKQSGSNKEQGFVISNYLGQTKRNIFLLQVI